MSPIYTFTAKIWLYKGDGAWHFITLPKQQADEIKYITRTLPRVGFGSVRVSVQSSTATWRTSIFPDKKSDSYLLPIKKDILKQLNIGVDDDIQISLQLVDI